MRSIKSTLKDIRFVIMAVIRNPFSKTAPPVSSFKPDEKFWKAATILETMNMRRNSMNAQRNIVINIGIRNKQDVYNQLESAGFIWRDGQWLLDDPNRYFSWFRIIR